VGKKYIRISFDEPDFVSRTEIRILFNIIMSCYSLVLFSISQELNSFWEGWYTGFLPTSAPTTEQLMASADAQLFKAIVLNPYLVLYSRLPEKCSSNYSFRPRALEDDTLTLPQKDDKNFLPCLLFKNIY